MRSTEIRNWQLEKCRNATATAGLTSAISEAPVITHRAEVLKDKDSHGGDDKQHHKHHNPDVSTEGLWGRKKTSQRSRLKQRTRRFWLIHIFIHSWNMYFGERQTASVYVPSDSQGRVGEEVVPEHLHSPDGHGKVCFLQTPEKDSVLPVNFWDCRDSFCHWISIGVFL